MSEMDATTAAADRAEKKKAQNREAQRAYRHRTKKRLEELQRQIEEHERNKSDNDSSMLSLRDAESVQADGLLEKQYIVPPSESPHLSVPYPANRGGLDRKGDISQEEHFQRGFNYRPNSIQSHLVGESDMHIASNSKLGGTKRLTTAPHEQQRTVKSSANFDDQWPFNDLNLLVAPVDDYGDWEHGLEMDFSQDNSDQFPPTTSTPSLVASSKATESSSSSISATRRLEGESDNSPPVPSPNANIEERIEYVLSCAKLANFEDLDSLIMAYYTENLNPASSISAEQRISRRRRLPQLLAKLREQSPHWTQWEQIGLEEEIIKTAEEICTSECYHLGKDWLSSSVFDSGFDSGTSNITPKTFQHELPYLWALLTSIVSSNSAIQQHERSSIVFANMILFCLWGRVPRLEIMSWLQKFLVGPPPQMGQST